MALLRAAAIPWRMFKGGRRRQRGSGSSGFFGITKTAGGRWQVRFEVAGERVHIGMCDEKEDAARLVDIILVVVCEEAPENFPAPFQEWLNAGGGDVPAELVAAALQRVGSVRVSGMVPVESTEAPAAASSLEKEIDEAITADPVKQSRAVMKLSDASQLKEVKWNHWNAAQGRHMESKGVKTVYNLATVDMDNVELALKLTSGVDTVIGRRTARRTLWNRKCAAAALLGVDDIGELPKLKASRAREPKEERTPKQQDALDVASRWVAHADTPDPAFVKGYATALAAIARRQLSKKSSGCDDGAEPPKKRHC